jgi:hypothetical protein
MSKTIVIHTTISNNALKKKVIILPKKSIIYKIALDINVWPVLWANPASIYAAISFSEIIMSEIKPISRDKG